MIWKFKEGVWGTESVIDVIDVDVEETVVEEKLDQFLGSLIRNFWYKQSTEVKIDFLNERKFMTTNSTHFLYEDY